MTDSVLLPETRAILAKVPAKPAEALFKNPLMAEQFEAAHKRGRLVVHPRTDGKFIVYDPDRPVAQRTVAVRDTADAATLAAEEILRVEAAPPAAAAP